MRSTVIALLKRLQNILVVITQCLPGVSIGRMMRLFAAILVVVAARSFLIRFGILEGVRFGTRETETTRKSHDGVDGFL